jgi:hypothetical protein
LSWKIESVVHVYLKSWRALPRLPQARREQTEQQV